MIEALANVEAAIDITQLCSLHIPLESHLHTRADITGMLNGILVFCQQVGIDRLANGGDNVPCSLQLADKSSHFLLGFLCLLLVNLGSDSTHVLNAPVVADITKLTHCTFIDSRRIG